MTANSKGIRDEDWIYAMLSEYLDGRLNQDQRKKFDNFIAQKKLEHLASDFGVRRGKLQISAQKLSLSAEKIQEIHSLVEDDVSRANHEAQDIEIFGRSEMRNNALRYTLFFGILLGSLFFGIRFFSPVDKAPFKALESLVYETAVLSEESSERLTFPTDSPDDLNRYFAQQPELGFKVRKLFSAGSQWGLVGGTVLDYDVAKVVAVQWADRKTDEKLHLFIFSGEIETLPSSPLGNFQGLVFQSYATDKLNVIAWQIQPNLMGMLIGYRGAKELAELGYRVVGL